MGGMAGVTNSLYIIYKDKKGTNRILHSLPLLKQILKNKVIIQG